MYKHTGSLATENRNLKRIQQIRALTFEGLKSRDDVIAKLQTKLQNISKDIQVNSDNSRLERQKQTNITAKQQFMHEKVKCEQQLQLQQQQQQLQQQRQQLQQQQQIQQQQQQQIQQKQRVVKKKNELTYFDNLDEQNNDSNDDSTSSFELENGEISDENSDNSSDTDNSRNMQPNRCKQHRRKVHRQQRYAPYKKQKKMHQRHRNVNYSGDNPPLHRHLQSYYDKC